MGDFKPSEYQADIYRAFKYEDCNILVGAVAGSGKTSTLIELLKMATGQVTFLAFNKAIVTELEKKVPKHVNVMTMHSMGIRAILRKHGKLKINGSKSYKFIKSNIEEKGKWKVDKKEQSVIYHTLTRMIDIYRLTLCESKEDLKASADKVGIEYKKKYLDFAMDVIYQLERYNKSPKEIDFTDMIYLPATDSSYYMPASDLWMVDECQDLSPCQHLLFKRARRKSRFIAVGDPKQAIYGFAGADSNSFSKFSNYSNTKQMPLSICYRCPQKVVMHANKVYDIMESPEWMQMGEVYNGDYMDAKDGDMIVCRNVNPLIDVFFKLIQKGVKCFIKGKDIGENLIRLIKPYESRSLEDMLAGFQNDLQALEGELITSGITKPRIHPRYVGLQEKVGAIQIISFTYDTPRRLINALEVMFSDEGTGVSLSSIHKAKGLEAKNVFLLNKHLIPSQYAKSKEQLTQEKNLLYVAITRSKEKLIYCYV